MNPSDRELLYDLESLGLVQDPESYWDRLPKFGQTRVTPTQRAIIQMEAGPSHKGPPARRFTELGSKVLLGKTDVCEVLQWKFWSFYATEYGFGIEGEMPEVQRFLEDINKERLNRLLTPREFLGWAKELRIQLPDEFTAAAKKRVPNRSGRNIREMHEHKAECQRVAKEIWAENRERRLLIVEVFGHPRIEPFRRAYADKTVTAWISEVNPYPSNRGRKKKSARS